MTFTTLGTKCYITTNGSGDILFVFVSAATTPGADEANWTYSEQTKGTDWIRAMQNLNYADSSVNHAFQN